LHEHESVLDRGVGKVRGKYSTEHDITVVLTIIVLGVVLLDIFMAGPF
jgi:hypothetical protein